MMQLQESTDTKALLANLDKLLTKKYGKDYYGPNTIKEPVTFHPSGSLNLDDVLGGGIPEGRILEIYGNESSGKSLICGLIVAAYQASGHTCAWLDVEHAFDASFMASQGVDTSSLLILEPGTSESALNMIKDITTNGQGAVRLIIVDSVAAMSPSLEQEKDIGESTMALLAKQMSIALKQYIEPCKDYNTTIIFINQTRDNMSMFSSKPVTGGGKALRYYASIRLEVKRKGYIVEDKNNVGLTVWVKAEKNKVGLPFKETEINIYFEHPDKDGEIIYGVDKTLELVNRSAYYGLLRVSSSWYYIILEDGTEKKAQGAEGMKKLLVENPDIRVYLEGKLRQTMASIKIGSGTESE